jgi:predicted enzyme involved in methoxymalonyl-ACP biosynthesis
VQRTNQLTLTAHRYDVAAFDALLSGATCKAVRAWDKYGDFGIVGFVAWTPDRLRELVFSCRIAKKGVERRVLDMLPKGLAVDMVATERNAPIREIVAKWKNGN